MTQDLNTRRTRSIASALSLTAIAVAILVSCGDPPPPFEVRSIMPEPDAGRVRLNEPLALVFSADVDPSSVSEESVVVSSSGARVDGEVSARGARITFQPAPSSRADLADGAFPPDAQIEVRIGAFPSRTGVRSADGRPLSNPYRTSFRTSPLADPGPDGPFLDVVPNQAPRLADGQPLLLVDGWLRLRFSEPLWAGSIEEDTVQLQFDDLDRTRVPTEVRLVQGVDHADLFIRPVGGLVPGTPYHLIIAGGLSDLAGDAMTVTITKRIEIDIETEALRVFGVLEERH